MTTSPLWPSYERALHEFWQQSELALPPSFEPPVPFDTAVIAALALRRDPGPDYMRGMRRITSVTVVSEHVNAYRRRIELHGTAMRPQATTPQLVFDMGRSDEAKIMDCQVLAVPSVRVDMIPPEYMLSRIPLVLLSADVAGTLTPEFARDSRMPEVVALAVAAGAVMLEGMAR